MNKFYEYGCNVEVRYERKTDPREHNVAEMINTLEQRKAEMPKIDDDIIHVHDLKKKLESIDLSEIDDDDDDLIIIPNYTGEGN